MIQFDHISKSFDGGLSWAIHDVSLTLHQGEILTLLGSSGAGKSTLLKMANALIIPDQGQITLENKPISTWDPVTLRRSMGYVFQGIGLFPHMTVTENISIVLRLMGKSLLEQHQKSRELLALVGLDPRRFEKRFPIELSGGQQQRVGVARALAADPEYLLMDEPFGALDAVTRTDLQIEVLRIKKELNKTILFVTHDVFEAFLLGDRLAVLHKGKLEQIGTKKTLVQNPATPFVQNLLHNTLKQIESFKGLE